MKNSSIILMSIALAGTTSAQITFQKTYSNGRGNCVKQTIDGGYIIAGYGSFGAGNQGVYLIKTNNTGDTLWTRTYGSSGGEAGNAVQQTTDGGYIIAGGIQGGRYLIKTNNVGDTMWTKCYYNGEANAIRQTSDEGYIIASRFGVGFSSYYLALTKIDSMGTIQWSELITTAPFQSYVVSDVQQTTEGGYIAVGTINSGGQRVCLVKTDASGNVLWLNIYGGTVTGEGWSVGLTNDNGYIITGLMGSWDVLLLKTDSSGSVLWSKTYGGSGQEVGTSVQQTTDGGYIIAGYTNSFGAGNEDLYLVKTDGNGNLLWSKTYGGPGSDGYYFDLQSVQQTSDSGYIVTNSSTSFGLGFSDVYLIKTDSLGNSGCNESNPATLTTSPITPVTTLPSSVSIDGAANVPFITTIGGGGSVISLCISTGTAEIHGDATNNNFSVFPNPFSGLTVISFSLAKKEKISLNIFDANGRLVSTLADKIFEAGENELVWNASEFSSGLYFLKKETENASEIIKVSLVK